MVEERQIAPHEPVQFYGRSQGYVVRIYKVAWDHPVRYMANDSQGRAIAAGTVQQYVEYREFVVKRDTSFTLINVGEWPLIAKWP